MDCGAEEAPLVHFLRAGHTTSPSRSTIPSTSGLTTHISLVGSNNPAFGSMFRSSYQGSVSSSSVDRASLAQQSMRASLGMSSVSHGFMSHNPPLGDAANPTSGSGRRGGGNAASLSRDDKNFSGIASLSETSMQPAPFPEPAPEAPTPRQHPSEISTAQPTPVPLFELVAFHRRSTVAGGTSQVASLLQLSDGTVVQQPASTTQLTVTSDAEIALAQPPPSVATLSPEVRLQRPSVVSGSVTSSSSKATTVSFSSASQGTNPRLMASFVPQPSTASHSTTPSSSEALISMMSVHSFINNASNIGFASSQGQHSFGGESRATATAPPSSVKIPIAAFGGPGAPPLRGSYSTLSPPAPTHRSQAVTFDLPSESTRSPPASIRSGLRPSSTAPQQANSSHGHVARGDDASPVAFQFLDVEGLKERMKSKREARRLGSSGALAFDNETSHNSTTIGIFNEAHGRESTFCDNPSQMPLSDTHPDATDQQPTTTIELDQEPHSDGSSPMTMKSSVRSSSSRKDPRDVIAAVGGKEQFIERMRALYVGTGT